MNEIVTVIIPTYNRAKYIDRAIMSVLNQTYQNIEIIVVDDNDSESESRKEMLKKMKKYSNNKKVKYLLHTKNMNGAAARNTGIKAASGKYITFLDDDDYFLPTRIEKLVKKIKEEKVDCVYSAMVLVENKRIKMLKHAIKKGNLQLDILKQKSFIGTGSNMLFTASSLKEINGFDESFKRNQDLEVFVRFFEKYTVCPLDEILVLKINDDRSNVLNLERTYECKMHFLKTYEKQISKLNIQEIYHSNFLELLKLAIKVNDKTNFKIIRQHYQKLGYKLSLKDYMILLLVKIDKLLKINNLKKKLKIKRDIKYVDKEIIDFIANI